ncbi:MAG: ShlB/FhaC/HecB family hemolysin secretion/activation protein [Burkholderiales bacterium]
MKFPKRSALIAAMLGFITLQAVAQSPPDAGRLMQDQERLQMPEPLRSVPLPRLDEAARPPLQAPDSLRVRVTAFRFSRNTVFTEAMLAPLLADLIGKELSLADLNAAALRITDYYRKNGFFVASAYVPAQDIRDGVVEITVLEGVLDKLQLDNHSRVADRILQAYLSDLQQGRPLAGDTLERSLLLIDSLPGVNVQSTLKPGASIGATDLDIRVDGQARVGGNVSLDDYGNRFVGAWRPGVQLNANSPLGLGDSLSLHATTSDGHFDYDRLAYQLPVGGNGLQLGGAWSTMNYRLGLNFAPLEAHGNADIASIYALYPLQRTRTGNVNLQVNIDHKNMDDLADSTKTHTDKTVQLLTLGVSGDLVDTLAGSGFTSWSLAYAGGQLRLDPTAATLDAAGLRTNGEYGKWSAMVSRQQSADTLGQALSLWGQVSSQIAGKNLDSSEKFSLGGIQGVRAYPQGESPCDDALLANIEVRYMLGMPGFEWQLSGFYDAATGRLNHTPLATDTNNRQNLSGLGLGANLLQSGGLSVSTSLAWRTSRSPISDRDRMPRLWMNLQQRF